jgi:hypothetical protein
VGEGEGSNDCAGLILIFNRRESSARAGKTLVLEALTFHYARAN